ncbi:hypothetical protein BKA66DRAFT_35294 [Pyrenochaeta sp. MPI-SDFR-AT-0127]|nr:hypothetical protein BKA66DRAFT_35294 [Pyrenochaeta sp. MPI-SDFR-AT-0127]
MRAIQTLVATISLLGNVGLVEALELEKRAPFEIFGIQKNAEGFGSEPLAEEEAQAAFAPAAERHEKNVTMPLLQDRSLELTERQTCNTGYWYCPTFGRCCPRTNNCCSYGYCIDPAETCCPGGSCDPGYECCSATTCSPRGTECCADGNYCQVGNICVKLFDTGRIVCCTDLKCTAAVVSGTTSYRSTTTRDTAPTVTRPPTTTRQVADVYETWYWTVTWWYLSFYYTTFRAESTVTFSTVYSTTTFTTTATDRQDASSRFAILSRTLTFTPPASATSLASLVDVQPSETPSINVLVQSSDGPEETRSARASGRSSTAFSFASTRASATSTQGGSGSASTASTMFVQWAFLGFAALSGVLMIWL